MSGPTSVLGALALLALLVSPLRPAPVAAQELDFFTSSGREMSRDDLQAYLRNLEAAAANEDYADLLREQARAQAEAVRRRLAEGDFRVGDRIQVQVQGENWDQASPGTVAPVIDVVPTAGSRAVATGRGSVGATFAVQAGPSVKLPELPVISLRGVLRSELEEHLAREIGAYIIDPVVSARSLIRVSIFGAVGSPGFFYPAADQLLGDVIMLAGGPASTADYEDITVRRGDDVLWSGEQLQAVMAEGRTLDQMNLQAGDIIEVPERVDRGVWFEVGRYALIVGTTLLLGIRVF